MDNSLLGHEVSSTFQCPLRPAGVQRPLLRLKASSESHSGHVSRDSGLDQFAFHMPPEFVFSISRNPYSPFAGTLIHMPRIPQYTVLKPKRDPRSPGRGGV